jgi:antitoxin component of MazEF toxin-antitoxin module
MIKTKQKLIKIGSSKGVTIPAKQVEELGAAVGDMLFITAEVARRPKHDKLMQDYDKFVQQYGTTLKNLAKR